MYLDTDGKKEEFIFMRAGIEPLGCDSRSTSTSLVGAAPVTSPRCFRVGDRHIRYPSLC